MSNILFDKFKNSKTEPAIIQVISENEGIEQHEVKSKLDKFNKINQANQLNEIKEYLIKYGMDNNLSLTELVGYTEVAIQLMVFDSQMDAMNMINKIKLNLSKEE